MSEHHETPPELTKKEKQRRLFSGPLAFMAKNSVAANLLMAILMIGGLLMAPRIKQEVFPEVNLDIVTVSVAYPGASPSEVEKGVILPIESAVGGIDGVKTVRATASEGVGTVTVELLTTANPETALNDIKSSVDRITSFPPDIERPTVSLLSNRMAVISLVLYGDASEHQLHALAERAKDELLQDPRVTLVELSGVRPLEISVEVPQEKLRAFGVTLSQVAGAISAGSIELPGGSLKTPGGERLVRTTERKDRGSEFGDIRVMASPDGSEVKVSDLAHIDDGFADTDQETSFNGKRAVEVQVYRVGDQGPIEVSDAVKEYKVKLEAELPEGVEVETWSDRSELFRDRIDLMLRNGYAGLILVLLVLGIFLELRLAFWVTLGIPISFLGSMLFMPSADVSINMISMFAFILTLGIVVDDAIVVGEAVYKYREEGYGPLQAALKGSKEIAGPVIFSVLTTMVAFTPMLFVPGVMGKFFKVIPIIVIIVLFLSLVEALFILPAHLSHIKGKPRGLLGFVFNLQQSFAQMLDRVFARVYTPVVRAATYARYATLALGVATLILTVGLIRSGRVPFTFMPKVEGDIINVTVTMPPGTSVDETRRVQDKLLSTAQTVFETSGGEENLSRGIFARVGSSAFGMGPRGGGGSSGSHITQVSVYLVPAGDRDITTTNFVRQWRDLLGEIPGAENVNFQFTIGPPTGDPVDIELSHPDLETLEAAASDLAKMLTAYEGVKDIDDGFSPGKEQLDVVLKPEARSLGITEQALARQLRSTYFGAEAVRQLRGTNEVRVYVRAPDDERDSEADIRNLLIRANMNGQMTEIPLEVAADVKRGRSYTQIKRRDNRRVVNVKADVDTEKVTAGKVLKDVTTSDLVALMDKHPGLRYSLAGEQQEQAETFGALRVGGLIAVIVMFGLMAIAFGSYVQPLIIMIAIPFGIVGAVLGHIVMGYGLSMVSMLGILALSGVVVNDSLVLVAASNQFYDEGMSRREAVIAGALRRFRPILLTTLTTFFGLMPMILETSVQARFLIPMAISLGFGVLFTTFVILLMVPAVYLIVEDIKGLFIKLRNYVSEEPDDKEPPEPAPSEPGPSEPAPA